MPVLALATVLARLLGLTDPVRADEAGFTLVARAWSPTADSVYGPYFVDRPPLLVAVYGALDALAGPLTVRVVGALACGLLVLLAAYAGRLVAGARARCWAALAVASVCVNPLVDLVGVKGELLGAPLVMGAVVLALLAVRRGHAPGDRWRAVGLAAAAGCCASLPLGLKQSLVGGLVFTGVLLLAAAAWRRIGPRRLLATALAALAGAAVPVLAQAGWAVGAGVDLDTLWYAVATFRSDASEVLAAQPSGAPLSRAVVLAAVGVGAGLVLVVGGFVVHAVGEWADDPVLTLAVAAMLAVDATALVLSGSYWRDYLFALLPSAALAAALLTRRRPSRRATAMRWVVGFSALSAVVCVLGWVVLQVGGLQPHPEADTGRAVARAAEPGDTLTVFGGRADLQLASGLPSPYTHLWSLPMRTMDPDLRDLEALLRSADRPTWLVEWVPLETWTPEAGSRLREVLEEHYRRHGTGCSDAPVWLARGVERPEVASACPGLELLVE